MSGWAAKQAAKQREITEALEDDVRYALIQVGFAPVDDDVTDLPADLRWIVTYGLWDAWRGDGQTVDLCRFSEDGITVTRCTRNYVILSEARFDLTGIGVAWFTKVINPNPPTNA